MPTKTKEKLPDRRIMVFTHKKSFVLTVPGEAKTTFGPWSPPTMRADKYAPMLADGTLRVYGKTKEHVLAVIPGCVGFRDLSLNYMEVDPDIVDAAENPEYNDELVTVEVMGGTMCPLSEHAKIALSTDEDDIPF